MKFPMANQELLHIESQLPIRNTETCFNYQVQTDIALPKCRKAIGDVKYRLTPSA